MATDERPASLDAVRARVAPVLLQDLDAVYEEFVLETGTTDPLAFVAHLREWELVPAELADELLGVAAAAPHVEPDTESGLSGPEPPEPPRPVLPFMDDDKSEGEEAATHVMKWDDGELEAEARFEPTEPTTPELPFEDEPTTSETAEAETVHVRDRRELLASLGVDPPGKPSEPPPEPTRTPGPPAPVTTGPLPSLTDDSTVAAPDEGARRARFRKVTGGLRQTGGYDEAGGRPRRLAAGLPTDPTGRYLFVGTVGEGAMGRVHLAKDRTLHRRVAYKEMNEELLQQPVLASRFAAEVRITAQLDHPGIVPVYQLEGERAYTMRLVEGRTLAGLLGEARAAREARRPVPKAASRERLLELFARVCDTVAYAHSRGVLHRDLKPDNIMVGAYGEAYVMDWGIAKVVDRRVEHAVEMGSVEDEGELVIGTPGHMSPEQANGRNDALDARSDQYALGIVLFEILTLGPAVTGKTALALVTRQQEAELDPLVHTYGDRIGREWKAIATKALSANPAARYADVGALADDVRRGLRGEPVAARPEGPIARVARVLARHREATLLLLLLLVAGTVLTAGAGVGFASIQASRAAAREQAMTSLLTTAAHQASVAEGQLLKFQGLLSVASTMATDALRQPDPGGREGWYAPDFAATATAPSDAESQEAGTKYGPGLVSPHHPVWVTAPGVDREAVRPQARRLLGPAERHLPRVLLRSHDEARATVAGLVRRTVLETRIPARWIWIALEDGLYASYPGHGGWPDGFDFRTTDAWKRGRESRAPRWGAPEAHPTGRAPVITVTQALVDDQDRVVGVAGLDIALDWVVENLLLPEELRRAGVEGFLVDAEGRLLVRSSSAAPVAGDRRLDVPEVLAAIAERRSGRIEERGTLVLFHRLPSNGWYHVIRGPSSALLP